MHYQGLPNWDQKFDVVVVGAGAAGMCAAIEAADLGAKVLLIEKTKIPSGSTSISAGVIALAGTRFQKEHGIHDSAELFLKDLERAKGFESLFPYVQDDLTLVERRKICVYRSAELYEWLTSLGVEFSGFIPYPGHTVLRTHLLAPRHFEGGAFMLNKLKAALEERGAEILCNTSAQRLYIEGGRIVGLKAQDSTGHIKNIKCKSVVLCTGGWYASESLRRKYYPYLVDALNLGWPYNTGDGLLMAQDVGADVKYMCRGLTCHVTPIRKPIIVSQVVIRKCIVVSVHSRRIADESKIIWDGLIPVMEEMTPLERKGPTRGFVILDENIRKIIKKDTPVFEDWYKEGLLEQADTIGELARKIGLDPLKLKNTVDCYNNALEKGIDPEPPKSWDPSCRYKIEKPPFYAMEVGLGFTTALGGLSTNIACQVLNVFNEPIPGLYAAGEIITNPFLIGDLCGLMLLSAMICGRIAGINAAKK